MTLENLQARAAELVNSINMTTNQLFLLQGQKNEVDYHIELAKVELESARMVDSNALADTSENLVV